MPRQQGISIQNKFIRGLITEATALSFPEDACTETNNVVFDPTGRITRRPGFDTEASYTSATVTVANTSVYTEFVWNAVAGDGNISFLAVQHDDIISFYDISDSVEVSGNRHATTIDLTTYLAQESTFDPGRYECQFAAGNGNLFVVNPKCDPFYVTYSPDLGTITVTEITLQERDFEGLEDNLAVDSRPTDTVSGTANPNHLYNLINQGWGLTDALTQWDTARTDLPSNADYAELYRNSASDAFDNGNVAANDPGNRPAPKGHFILDVSRQNRQEVFEAEGYTAITTSSNFSLIDRTAGSTFTNRDNNPSAIFDGDRITTNTCYNTVAAASAYAGKDYGSSPKAVSKVVYYPASNVGYTNGGAPTYPLTLTLYGKNTTPASGTDGTSLGSTSLGSDTTAFSTVTSNELVDTWRYVWVNTTLSGGTSVFDIAELDIFTSSLSFERPSCVEFFAGRVFYGGISTQGVSSNIYFTQIIENTDQYGACYQKNDPTSQIPDLLADDGGVIKIPEMGTLKRLYSYQSALLAFASNGVWLIAGTSGSNFKATDYIVKKISSIGMNSPLSLVSIRGLPAWWGEDGIYTVQFDANYDSFTPVSITLKSIDRFYQAIPLANKRYVKGTYDENGQVAYWLYNDDEDLNTDFYKYNNVLCLDAKSQAFYTWEISAGPIVRSINYLRAAMRNTDGKLKLLVHRNYNGSSAGQTFGEIQNTNYKDWESEGTNVDFTSSFVTGYKLDGQTQKFFQPNYVFIFLETEENASCYMQGIYDFTTSSAEGKWSTRQQVYNENLTNRGTNFRKLKVRGKGRALQLKFESETQKPFTIIGWSLWETTNTGV